MVRDLDTAIQTDLDGCAPHLLLLFVSPSVHPVLPALLEGLRDRMGEGIAVVGCTAQGVASNGREREQADGVTVMAAHLPDVCVLPFYAAPAEARNRTGTEWRTALDLIPEQQPVFILLPDPFSINGQALVDRLDEGFPSCPKVGGLASGGQAPGSQRVFCNDRIAREGAVGVALWGDIRMATVVAQGARPIGPILEVTEASGPAIRSLNGRSVLTVLEEVFGGLTQEERISFQRGPAIGLAPGGSLGGALQPHDFLIRNMLGFKRSENALMIGANAQTGDHIQLRIRDAVGADRELRELVARLARNPMHDRPSGALIFACLGRGQRFFGVPDHDVHVLRSQLGHPPLAGFFCNGELGPVRGRTWLHGYTSSFGLFYPRGWS